MNRTTPAVTLMLLAVPLLAGCGDSASRTFGLSRDAPDEFTVTTRAPLSLPPTYDLRPPAPGESRPQEQTTARAAEEALVPQSALSDPGAGSRLTRGQSALIAAAGPQAPQNIRGRVDADAQLERPNRGFTDKLMFWQGTPPPSGSAEVDPEREAQRLRANAALGTDARAGDTPVIQPQEKSFLQRLGDIF